MRAPGSRIPLLRSPYGPRQSRTACPPAKKSRCCGLGEQHRLGSQYCCRGAHPRWRCCRQLTARRRRLAKRRQYPRDQLAALLAPQTVAAGEDPRGPYGGGGNAIITGRPNDGGVSVGRQRNGVALLRIRSSCAGADQLAAMLAPLTVAEGEDPCRPGAVVVELPAHDGGAAVAG
jgi:hypothetical protein